MVHENRSQSFQLTVERLKGKVSKKIISLFRRREFFSSYAFSFHQMFMCNNKGIAFQSLIDDLGKRCYDGLINLIEYLYGLSCIDDLRYNVIYATNEECLAS